MIQTFQRIFQRQNYRLIRSQNPAKAFVGVSYTRHQSISRLPVAMSSKHHHYKSIASNVHNVSKSMGVKDEQDRRRAYYNHHDSRRLLYTSSKNLSSKDDINKSERNDRPHKRKYVDEKDDHINNSKKIRRDRSRSPVYRSTRYEPRYVENSLHHSKRDRKDDELSTHKKTLQEYIEEMIITEDHHIEEVARDVKDRVSHISWCPKYVSPKIKGRIIGGSALLHHRCRSCGQICLHLLGKYGSSQRYCLKCEAGKLGWDEKDVPSWYYHPYQCHLCRRY